MNKLFWVTIATLFISSKSFSQDGDSLRYTTDNSSLYYAIQHIWLSQDGISYMTIPTSGFNNISAIGKRRVPLREGEGKNGVFLAANLDFRLLLFMGRAHNKPWMRRIRSTFDYRVNFRMTNDESKPIVPYSQDVGFGLDIALYDNINGFIWKDQQRQDLPTYLHFTTLKFKLHHYSNGQSPGFFFGTPDGIRNDYLSGDFSTNFFSANVVSSLANTERKDLYNVGLGLRADWGLESGGFIFSPEQEKRYGKLRVEYLFDYYTGPVGKNKYRMREWHFRLKGDYIADNLDLFIPNLQNTNKKYRFSSHLFVEYRPLISRSVGYMIHLFYGRDYLNIRYDDIVFIAMGGLSFTINKYYPIGWNPF